MTYLKERFANAAETTLSSAITSSTTSLSVNSATPFPTTGNFRIIIDFEIMLVTGVSGTTFTVVRGAEGTTAANHLVNSDVTQILTKGSVQRILRDNVPLADDDNRPAFSLLDASGNVLTSSSFTVVNGTLATVTDELSGPITVSKTKLSSGGEDVTFLARSAPATPYQVYAAMEGALLDPSEYSGFGIGFRESSSGKLTIMVLGMAGGGAFPVCAVYNFASPTSYSSPPVVSRLAAYLPTPKWFKIGDDGTNLNFYVSHNGTTWILVGSQARTIYMTGGPDQVGFCLSSSYNTSYEIAATLLAWNGA